MYSRDDNRVTTSEWSIIIIIRENDCTDEMEELKRSAYRTGIFS